MAENVFSCNRIWFTAVIQQAVNRNIFFRSFCFVSCSLALLLLVKLQYHITDSAHYLNILQKSILKFETNHFVKCSLCTLFAEPPTWSVWISKLNVLVKERSKCLSCWRCPRQSWSLWGGEYLMINHGNAQCYGLSKELFLQDFCFNTITLTMAKILSSIGLRIKSC